MAVASESYKDSYAGTTTTGPYAITFPVVLDAGGNASDIKVLLQDEAGTETDITLTSTVTGLNVYTAASYAATKTVVLIRYPALTQPYTFEYKTKFPSKNFENALDRLTYLVQRMSLLSDQSLKAALSDPAISRLPSVPLRALKFLAFDADGDPVASGGVGSVAINALWEAALAADLGTNWEAALGAALGTNWATAFAADLGAGWATQMAKDYVWRGEIERITTGAGDWTVPAGVYRIRVTCVGGGGGGGEGYGSTNGNNGAAGGSTTFAGATTGAGGGGGFGAIASLGGRGGFRADNVAGCSGGYGTTEVYRCAGHGGGSGGSAGFGGAGGVGGYGGGGGGGASAFGSGGGGGGGGGGTNISLVIGDVIAVTPGASLAYSVGAGGAGGTGGTGADGGAGGSGIIIIEY